MKNFYELSTREKDQYRDEFNKLESTKKVNKNKFTGLLLTFFFLIAAGILSSLAEEVYKFLDDYASYMMILTTFCFIIYLIYEVISRISFMRWLKIKYNIEY